MRSLVEFQAAMRAVGLEPPTAIHPGVIHRFPGIDKPRGNTSGWCVLFTDGHGGSFGDWSCGLSRTWFYRTPDFQAPYERAKLDREAAQYRRLAREARRDLQIDAAHRAQRIWESAPAASSDHPYLITKQIAPFNARLHQGCLVLPITGFDGVICGLQFIDPHGNKRFLTGSRKQGCFIAVSGDEAQANRIIICEGWATGCTLAASEPSSLILAAIDAGNLKPVAVKARYRWPSTELVIAGDDDRLTAGNPGATKANSAAVASGALLALPEWPKDAPNQLSDFNDLAMWLMGGGS